jgi:hypothetical protein
VGHVVSSTATNVAQLCLSLDRKVHEYADAVRARAEAEVAYKSERAKRILRAKSDGAKSIAESETVADADDGIRDLRLAYLIAEGHADATGRAISALRERIGYGRSLISTERAADLLHAQNLGGAA